MSTLKSFFSRKVKQNIKSSLSTTASNGYPGRYNSSLPYGSGYGADSTYLYEALGYPENITYDDYNKRYHRQDIAQRVIRAPVDATWRYSPTIEEVSAEKTVFEQEMEELADRTSMYSKLRKADILSSIGRYAVVYIGFDNSIDLAMPPKQGAKVSYFTPISEKNAAIKSFDNDIWSPRYGLPLTYELQSSVDTINSTLTIVHWSRVIHIAENTLESEVYGIPKLEPIYNRLIGLEKLAGGSPEMYWKGARPGYLAQAAENSVLNEAQLDQMKEQLSDFVNNLTRWLFSEGVEVQSLAPQVVAPTEHVEVQLKLISAASNIPLRILVGSEKGELASGQDERAWLSYIDARRKQVAEDLILRPLIDRLIFLGSVVNPKEPYYVVWKSINVTSEKERAEVGRILTDALLKYTSSPGGSSLIPVEKWLEKVWDFSPSEVQQMLALNNEDEEIID